MGESLEDWRWSGGKLFHKDALSDPMEPPRMGRLRRWLLDRLYAAQNRSRNVRRTLSEILQSFPAVEWGLNVGAGSTSIHPRIINVDLFDAPNINVVTRGERLPFSDGTLSLVIAQEVLEHTADPHALIKEIHRILKDGGRFYCQVPFVIGYHSGPKDYWRFTNDGLRQMFGAPGWRVLALRRTVGHGTGLYRIAVEFVAVTSSAIHRSLYLPSKAMAAVILWPLTWFDVLTPHASEPDRIPGGYLCVAEKQT